MEALIKIKEVTESEVSLITLGPEGIAVLDNDLKIYPVTARQVFDVTGAGDTVIAALGYCLSQGKTLASSIEFANIAAGIVVGKPGVATASLEEVLKFYN